MTIALNKSAQVFLTKCLAIFFVQAGLFAGEISNSELSLSSVFGHHMVVQREQPISVWGEAPPGAEVRVSLGERSAKVRAAAAGTWNVQLAAMPAGGPFTLLVSSGKQSILLTNILSGDLWLCSGQSNMQLPWKEVEPNELKTLPKVMPNLRLCSVARAPSVQPVRSSKIDWQSYTPDSAGNFSAVAGFFAMELLKAISLSGVPLGVVDCSFGGTTCEAWIPASALGKFNTNELHDSFLGFRPAQHYNGMIAPLGAMTFKGVLWYQGESNSGHPETYPALLATMVREWRGQFQQPDLPFLVVQLPEYANLWEGFYWPWIREMQAQAVQAISNTTLVVALQTADGFDLHPKQKLEIGRRAALAARRLVYEEKIVACGPVFQTAVAEGSALRLSFETFNDGLASLSREGVKGFELAGMNGEYYYADARLEGESVVVESDQVKQPKTVRYAWGAMPQGSLVNKSGLPAPPFRTDQQPYSNVELQPQPARRRVATSAYELVIDANGMPSSLVIRGRQFLSNEAGGGGGVSIPGFWGPRSLNRIKELGPRRLTCGDDDVTLQMIFEEKAMNWTLTNRGREPIRLQVALSPLVQAPPVFADGKITLVRGEASLTLEGIDSLTNTPTGPMVFGEVKAASTKVFFLK